MKKQILIVSLGLALTACSKEWECTITTDQTYMGNTSHSVTNTTFTGTTNEKEDFELSGTHSSNSIQQNTECK